MHLIISDDDNQRRPRPIGGLHRTLEPTITVGHVHPNPGTTQSRRHSHGHAPGRWADRYDEYVNESVGGHVEALRLARQQCAIGAQAEPDP